MTTPLISFINICFKAKDKRSAKKSNSSLEQEGVFKVLLSFGRAGSGSILLNVANQLFGSTDKKLELTALHLTVGTEVNPLQTDQFERISFEPILTEARRLHMPISTRYDISTDAGAHICDIVNNEGFDFLLVGAGVAMSNIPSDIEAAKLHQSLRKYLGGKKSNRVLFLPNALLKDKTRYFIEQSNSSVGIFVNRGFQSADSIIIIIKSANDLHLLQYAKNLSQSTPGTRISILEHIRNYPEGYNQISDAIASFLLLVDNAFVIDKTEITSDLFTDFNLMLISYETWNDISEQFNSQLMSMPSTLIIRHK